MKLKIGNVEINGVAVLAPMAGVTDRAFRELCVDFGASYVVSEMVSSKGIVYDNDKTNQLMYMSEKEHPCAIQLFGNEPDTMAKAAKVAVKYKPEIIDINMGCPAPKITSNGCGCALMKEPKLCGDIVYAVKNAVDIPVTVKIRKGWDKNSINAIEVAKICENSGADAIAIHGRTKEQMYSLNADWDIIREIKQNVNIPVIGNGDIYTAKDALNMIEQTGCDLVMVGRGALGNPWIFSQINSVASCKDIMIKGPSISQRVETMLEHIKLICKYKGEAHGIKEARKHITWYIKGINCAAEFRKEAGEISSIQDVVTLCNKILSKN